MFILKYTTTAVMLATLNTTTFLAEEVLFVIQLHFIHQIVKTTFEDLLKKQEEIIAENNTHGHTDTDRDRHTGYGVDVNIFTFLVVASLTHVLCC